MTVLSRKLPRSSKIWIKATRFVAKIHLHDVQEGVQRRHPSSDLLADRKSLIPQTIVELFLGHRRAGVDRWFAVHSKNSIVTSVTGPKHRSLTFK